MKGNFNWSLALIVFVITLGGMIVFSLWHRENIVSAPIESALEEIEGINEVKVENDGELLVISVDLQTRHLPRTYREMEEELQLHRSPDSFTIELKDRRTGYLESIYDTIHFSLMEAERMGNYREMQREVGAVLKEQERLHHYVLGVDKNRIYLHLSESGGYLYEVIEIGEEDT